MSKIYFKIPQADTRFGAHWPVTVDVPVDGGKIEEQKLDTHFQLLSDAEVKAYFDKAVKSLAVESGDMELAWKRFGPASVLQQHKPTCLEFLGQVITKIEGLKQASEKADAPDDDVEYSAEVLKGICEMTFVRRALVNGYFTFHAGVEEKNL